MALSLFFFAALAVTPAQAASVVASPVDKVVSLLTELESALTSDEKAEQSVYDKYACWCEETTAHKAMSIEDAKKELKQLGHSILKLKGTVAVRTEEIAEKQAEIKANEEAQEDATSARSKENAAWQAESDETKQALAGINTAMDVLMKATKPALLQQDATARLQISLSNAVAAAPAATLAKLSSERRSQLQGFVASLAQAKGKAGYAPQSMTIQGILSDMYTTMSVDLMSATAAEAKQNHGFEEFMAEKDKELSALKKIFTKKQREKTEAEAMLSESTEAFDEVSKQLNADVEFFDVTKDACKEKTDEWNVRSGLRTEELKGVKEALKILNSDEAKKLFEKSIKPGMETTFLQVDATPSSKDSPRKPPWAQAEAAKAKAAKAKARPAAEKAYQTLKVRATKSHSLRLAALAAQVHMSKAGHFDKVIKSIDDLIVKLGKDQDADTKKRDHCEEQYQDIAQESSKLKWMVENNEAKIEKLKNKIETREDEKKQTESDIDDTKKNIKDMKAEREKENGAFVQAKKDDLAAVDLLENAKEKLMEFYKKEGVKMGPVLFQADEDPKFAEDPAKAPAATFSDKGKRKNQSKGIVSIMTMLIEDLQAEIANGIKAEESAQLAFEKALAAAEKLLEDLDAKKVSLEEAIAKRNKEKIAEGKDKDANEKDLTAQNKEKDSITEDCDYMIAKYTERRKYRDAEIEALTDAKESLSSYYDDESLVQSAPVHEIALGSFTRLASPQLRN